MKSYGQLWERVTSPENLAAALGRVLKGRTGNPPVAAFAAHGDEELAALREDLLSGAWRPGPYAQFRVTDPKPRTISCAPVRDRVAHHALCGVIAPSSFSRTEKPKYGGCTTACANGLKRSAG